jgi:hypothetical protein
MVDPQIHCESASRTSRQDDMGSIAHTMISEKSLDHCIPDPLAFEMNLPP